MKNTEELVQELKEVGFNRDVEITKEDWNVFMDGEHGTSLSLAAIEHRDELTYRDEKEKTSVELKDYRPLERQEDFVAELEHFNPESCPLRHLLVDFPLWLWKNRIKNKGPVPLGER